MLKHWRRRENGFFPNFSWLCLCIRHWDCWSCDAFSGLYLQLPFLLHQLHVLCLIPPYATEHRRLGQYTLVEPIRNNSPPFLPRELVCSVVGRQERIVYGKIKGHKRIDIQRIDDCYKQTAAVEQGMNDEECGSVHGWMHSSSLGTSGLQATLSMPFVAMDGRWDGR